jgi:hypothetical protein
VASSVERRRWHAAAVGLAQWQVAAKRALAEERAAQEAHARPMEARDELLGLLSARQAQIRRVTARDVALDPELLLRAQELEERLRRPPIPLAEAQRLTATFEADLRAALRRSRS